MCSLNRASIIHYIDTPVLTVWQNQNQASWTEITFMDFFICYSHINVLSHFTTLKAVRLKCTIPGHPFQSWNSKTVICVLSWDNRVVVIAPRSIQLCACMQLHYLVFNIHICVGQQDKIPVWWIIASHDFLLCLISTSVHTPWFIPHTEVKITQMIGVSLISHLVLVTWTRHNPTYRISYLASKKPLVQIFVAGPLACYLGTLYCNESFLC